MTENNSKESNGNGGVLFGEAPNVHISGHPIIAHKITQLRSSATNCGTFRSILKEVTYHLGYEATTSLTTKPVNINVPAAAKNDPNEHYDYVGSKLAEQVALIPILRSGLGMVDSMLEILPKAAVHHIGMYKSAGALTRPVQYYNRLPRNCTANVAYIMDVTIATSSTILSVIGILKKVRLYLFCILCCMFPVFHADLRGGRIFCLSSLLNVFTSHASSLSLLCSWSSAAILIIISGAFQKFMSSP